MANGGGAPAVAFGRSAERTTRTRRAVSARSAGTTASASMVTLSSGLKGVRVSDVMTSDCLTLDGNMNVEQFVEGYLLKSGRRCFVVGQGGEVAGLVTPHEVKELERQRWTYTTLHDIMRPLDQLHTVAPGTPTTPTPPSRNSRSAGAHSKRLAAIAKTFSRSGSLA